MLLNGIILMVIGMLTVFIFLIIMVIVVNFSAFIIKFLTKIWPEVEEDLGGPLQKAARSSEDIAIAIAAVKNYISN